MNKVHLTDCMEFMKTCEDNQYDLAIVDPPFPINTKGGGRWRKLMQQKDWDNSIPGKEYFKELKRVTEHQIIWGGNYFTEHLSPNNNWVVWHKNNYGAGFSECELAWSSIRKNIRYYEERIVHKSVKWHACAKPINLYKWLLTNYAKPGNKILDTHIGSGSIRIACHDLGFDLEGCELDPDYYRDQEARFKRHTQQTELFGKEEIQNLTFN